MGAVVSGVVARQRVRRGKPVAVVVPAILDSLCRKEIGW
jgi:hypothetical protein